MWYVYILKSDEFSDKTYVGATSDLRKRIKAHNTGGSKHTSKFMPWSLIWYCAFQDKLMALQFEKYLKSSSGKAFTNKRLVEK